MQSISIFIDIFLEINFYILEKNADVSKTQGVCHMVYTFFGSSLGKV